SRRSARALVGRGRAAAERGCGGDHSPSRARALVRLLPRRPTGGGAVMNPHTSAAPMKAWLAEPLPADVAQSLERLSRADDVQQIAVMPDVHLSGDVCVGVAVATRRLVYPSAVGGDIGCGMAAIGFAA